MKVKNLFEKYDKNRNGVLERNEFAMTFKDLLKTLGEDFPDKKNEEVIQEGMTNFDLNKNGVIEYDEFEKLITFLIDEKGYSL